MNPFTKILCIDLAPFLSLASEANANAITIASIDSFGARIPHLGTVFCDGIAHYLHENLRLSISHLETKIIDKIARRKKINWICP